MDSPEPPRQPQRGDEYVGVIASVTAQAIATLPDGEKVQLNCDYDDRRFVWIVDDQSGASLPAEVERDLVRAGDEAARGHLKSLGLTLHDNDTGALGAVVRMHDAGIARELCTITDEPMPATGCLSDVKVTVTSKIVSIRWAAHHWAWQQEVDATDGAEAVAGWAEAVALDSQDLRQKHARWKMSGSSLMAFNAMATPSRPVEGHVKHLIPGLLSRGHLVLWVGKHGAGKSTVLNELAAKVGSSRRDLTFLGLPINQPACGRQLVAAVISGEDTASILEERRSLYWNAFGPCPGLISIDATRLSIEEALAFLDRLPNIDLAVFDTARKFLKGNEDDSGVWDPFLSTLMAWAEKRGCCVVITHHTKRCGAIRNLKQLEELIRGSSIIIQRPRFAVGQFELNGSDVGVGFMKFSLPPSAGEPFSLRHVHKVFRRVAETLSLEPVDNVMAATPPAAATHAADEQDRAVLAALQTVAAEGVAVFRTGAKSLYAMKRPELEGMSRRAVEAAIDRLVASGAVVEADTGLQPATTA